MKMEPSSLIVSMYSHVVSTYWRSLDGKSSTTLLYHLYHISRVYYQTQMTFLEFNQCIFLMQLSSAFYQISVNDM